MSIRMYTPTPAALIKQGDPEGALELILSRSWTSNDLDSQSDKDGTALFWAALRGYTVIVEVLIELGANVNTRSVTSGATPLHGASDNGHTDVTRILLSSGANASALNSFKDTPCHLAAYRGNAEIVCELLKSGTDCSLRNSRGNTVLDEAKCGQYTIVGGQHPLVLHILNAHVYTAKDKRTAGTTFTSGVPTVIEQNQSRRFSTYTLVRNHSSHDNHPHCDTCTCYRS